MSYPTHLLTGPEAISEDRYMEALEMLPPLRHRAEGGIETFFFPEFTSGAITDMYGRSRTHRCIVKPVDVTEQSTWITQEDFDITHTT